MATGARIVLPHAGWRVKPEFRMNTAVKASVTRKEKHLSGKITRAKLKAADLKSAENGGE